MNCCLLIALGCVFPSLLCLQAGQRFQVELNEELLPGPVHFNSTDIIPYTQIDSVINPIQTQQITLLDVPSQSQLQSLEKIQQFDRYKNLSIDEDIALKLF